MIEQLKPYHPGHRRSDYAEHSSIAEAVDEIAYSYPGPQSRTAKQTIEITDGIQDVVNQSLRFEAGSDEGNLLESQTGTCVGYAVVGSQALERAGIKHNVAFVNGHSTLFTSRKSELGESIRLVDMLTPELTQDISDKFILYRQLQGGDGKGRSFGTLNTLSLKNANPGKNPWLAIKDYSDVRLEPSSNRRLIVTLFTPEDGREVITTYSQFKRAAEDNDYEIATEALLGLDGIFPDIDIRGDSPDIVLKLVKKLSSDGRIDEAQEVTRSFYDSFVGEDTRLYEKRADCVAEIAKATKRPEFAKRALELYHNSLQKRRALKGPVVGKMAVSQALLDQQTALQNPT